MSWASWQPIRSSLRNVTSQLMKTTGSGCENTFPRISGPPQGTLYPLRSSTRTDTVGCVLVTHIMCWVVSLVSQKHLKPKKVVKPLPPAVSTIIFTYDAVENHSLDWYFSVYSLSNQTNSSTQSSKVKSCQTLLVLARHLSKHPSWSCSDSAFLSR